MRDLPERPGDADVRAAITVNLPAARDAARQGDRWAAAYHQHIGHLTRRPPAEPPRERWTWVDSLLLGYLILLVVAFSLFGLVHTGGMP